MRKVFLVAERLTWEEGIVSTHDKDLNEELNWKFNYELGILDPFVEDAGHVVGGKNSRLNRFYPYQNKHEMMLALKLIFMTESITETSWAVWISTQLDIEKMCSGLGEVEALPVPSEGPPEKRLRTEVEDSEPTVSPDHASRLSNKAAKLTTQPSSFRKLPRNVEDSMTPEDSMQSRNVSLSGNVGARSGIVSYRTLQDFYTLLDQIERTSYVGALFLEAYAERLRDDMCRTCWFEHNVKLDRF